MNKQIITSKTNWLVKLAPPLLWFLIILLPAISAKIIFSSALSMEKQLYSSRMSQKLHVELQKYDTALRPDQFLNSDSKMRKYESMLHNWLRGDDIKQQYRADKISVQLPDFSGPHEKVLQQLDQLSKRQIGTNPAALFILAENQDDCFWRLKTPMTLPAAADEFRQALASAWQIMEKRRSYGLNKVPVELQSFVDAPLLNKAVGTFLPIDVTFASSSETYSYLISDKIYFMIWVVPDFITGSGNRYIVAGFRQSDLSPHFMLMQTTESFTSPDFIHQFGLTQTNILPAYEENEDYMALTGELPGVLARLSKNIVMPAEKRPAIRVKCRRESAETILKKQIVNFVLSFILGASILLLSAVQLGRISSAKSLYRLVMAGFLIGITLPLSATVWLGICHMNSKNQLAAEKMLDFMQQQIALFEQKILLQKSRAALFNNIFTRWTGSLPIEKLRNLNQITGYSSNLASPASSPYYNKTLHRRLANYFFIHPDIDEDVVGMTHAQSHVRETLVPIFLSPTRDILFKLGAYNHISAEKSRQIRQKSELVMGLVDEALDRKLLSRLYAEEGTAQFNSMTTGREHIGCYFWKNSQHRKIGALFLQTKRSSWTGNVIRMIKEQKINALFYKDGYEMTLRLYFTNAHRPRTLDPENYSLPTRHSPDMNSLWETAQAMIAVSRAARINNLDSAQPQLLAGQTLADGEAYMLAHAVPLPGSVFSNQQLAFILLSLLAFIISYLLAHGVAWLLLRSIPVFQNSMQEMTEQNYRWRIELNSGDEFDKLAHTFNHLTRQLHEKNQISQLVSRNALDAINSGDDQMLKPGGSRVVASVLFADIRSFTTLTEKHPPEKIVAMLNDYFSLMAEQIESHGGIIDKLIGDAIQAVFYHHECENGAEAAVKAGLAMRAALTEFNQLRAQSQLFTIDNGVGIATGSVICGRVGSEHGKLDATIVGSLVSQAAHLESLSKSGTSSKVFIDHATAAMLGKIWVSEQKQIDARALEVRIAYLL